MSQELRPAAPTLADARRAVERSRERIAATLDELEDKIVVTRESIRRKVDVVGPARETIRKAPLIALGAAIVIGIFLGTRGSSDDDDDEEYGFDKDERKALEEWRKRRHKLLMDEAEDAGAAFGDVDEEEESGPGPIGRFVRMVGHEVAGVAVGIVAAEIAERLYGARSEPEPDEE